MAMKFTGTVSVANSGEQEIRELLFAALGCNLAWGVVDAAMYVLTNLADRGWTLRVARAIGEAKDAAAGRRIVAESLPHRVAEIIPTRVLEGIRAAIVDGIRNPPWPRFTREDLAGALGVFSLVVLATLPVTLPFVFISDVALALRVSNGVGLVSLVIALGG